MRRISGYVLLGVGAFLLTMAAMVKWYAYPTLAVAPIDQDSVTRLAGPGMTYFSLADRVEKTDDLSTTIRTIGDVGVAEGHGENVAVYDKSTVTETSDGTVISAETMRAAFDRTTGAAVTCCGNHINDAPVQFKGQLFKFPFATEQTTYEWWDGDLREAVPIQFQAEEEIDGLTVYRFTHTIEPTMLGTRDIPGNLLGEDPTKVLTAEEWYANTRTLWIEPETGAIVKAQEQPNTTFRYDGTDRIVATRGTTTFTDAQVAANVAEYSEKGGQLHLLRTVLPLAGLVLGLLFLALGAFLSRGARVAAPAVEGLRKQVMV